MVNVVTDASIEEPNAYHVLH